MLRLPMRKLSLPKWAVVVSVIVVILLIARAALPHGVKWYANRVLDQNPDYDGQIGDVDIHLWRGAYSIDDIEIIKTSGKTRVPFFETKELDLSVSWKELLRGAVVAKLRFQDPKINFVDGKDKEDKQTGKGQPWGKTLDELVPFTISQLLVENGAIHFRNFQADPPVDIWIKNLDAQVLNLTNSEKASKELFASCKAKGTALGDGIFQLEVRLNPRAEKPTFDLNAKLERLDLRALNSFFKKYAKLDFEKGRSDIVVEVAATNGQLKGYVKPILKNLQVLSLEKDSGKEGDNIFQVIWEAIAGTVVEILENQPKDQFATKIPISGPIKSPDTELFATIGGVLKNAFVSAFRPFYDNSISLKKARQAE
jgi:uncharacterized protein involved in outer membrane biogenesis